MKVDLEQLLQPQALLPNFIFASRLTGAGEPKKKQFIFIEPIAKDGNLMGLMK